MTQENWLVPTGSPRTLTNAPAATLTFLNPTVDFMTSIGYNNPNNLHFNIAGAFATPTSTFTPGNGFCTPNSGGLSSCNDLTTRTGIIEGNPFSLTQSMEFVLANDGSPNTISYTDATTKFSTPVTVPEPASLLLLGMGLAGLGLVRRFKS